MMKFEVRNHPDFFAGLLFIGLGGAFGSLSMGYRIGTAAQMGPGYFPLMLGGLLILLGLVIAIRSVTRVDMVERIEPIFWQPFCLVLGSVILFGLLLKPLGMVLSSFVLVLMSAYASHEFSWRYALVTTVVLIVACYGIFVLGLGLPMSVWPGVF